MESPISLGANSGKPPISTSLRMAAAWMRTRCQNFLKVRSTHTTRLPKILCKFVIVVVALIFFMK